MFSGRHISRKKIMEKSGSLLYIVFRYIFLLGISYIMLYPVLKAISQSLNLASDFGSGSNEWIPNKLTFSNYIFVLHYFPYLEKLKNTLLIVVISTALQLVISAFAGYGLARYRFKGNGLVFVLVIITIVFPTQSYFLPLYSQYRYFDFLGIGQLIGLFSGTPVTVNLLNTYWPYILPALFGVGLNSGLFIFVFRQFFMSLPKELEEAARVDGCNALTTYIRIVVPNAVPVFVTVGLLSTVFYWNDDTVMKMFITKAEKFSLLSYLEVTSALESYEKAETFARWSTALLLVQGPMMLLFCFGQKFFVECMDRSGIKG